MADSGNAEPATGSVNTPGIRTVTRRCKGTEANRHEPTTMKTTQTDDLELRSECPECGAVVMG